jgi:hypothetical protein
MKTGKINPSNQNTCITVVVKKNLRITGIDAERLAALIARAQRNNRSVEEEVLEIFHTEYADQPTSRTKTDE